MKIIYIALALVALTGCASTPRTHTEVPSLNHARSGVADAKDFNGRAIKSNNEIDRAVQELLKNSSE